MFATRRSFLAGGLAVAGLGEQDAALAAKVGVVNIRACFDKTRYARMAEMGEDLVKLKTELGREGQELQKRIQDLDEQMDAAKNTTDLYLEKFRQRGHAEYDLKLLQEVSKRRIGARVADLETRIYSDVRRVVAALARERGLDLVLRADDIRLPEEDPQANSVERNAARDVLYNRDALDLTAQVLARLNQDWAVAWTCPACKRKVADEKCSDCGAKRP